MSRERAEYYRQLAEGATRAATLLDRFNTTTVEGDKATAAAGEYWTRVMDELMKDEEE